MQGLKFVPERLTGGEWPVALPEGRTAWLVPINGSGSVAGVEWKVGECVTVTGSETIVAGADADIYCWRMQARSGWAEIRLSRTSGACGEDVASARSMPDAGLLA